MFGLEKKKKIPPFEFDLTKELKDESKQKKMIQQAEKHIQTIKAELRQGHDASKFEELGKLLNGYSALLKIMTNVTKS